MIGPRLLLVVPLLLLAAGCTTEISPEQVLADRLYADAQESLGRGEYSAGSSLLSRVIRLDQKLGRTARVAEAQRMLADIHAAAAAFDSALYYYGEASRSYRSIAERPIIRDITRTSAEIYHQTGRNRKAFDTYMELLRLTRVFGDSAGVRAITWDILPLCRLLNKRDLERQLLEELTAYYASVNDLSGRARVQHALGLSLFDRRAHDLGASNFAGVFSLALQARDSVLAVSALTLHARAMHATGKANDALQTYAEALKLVDRISGGHRQRLELLTRVGNLYLDTRQPQEAVRFHRAALSAAIRLGNRVAEGYLTVQLGHCELGSSLVEAGKKYQSARNLFENLEHSGGIAYALASLAEVFRRNGQLPEAVQLYTSSIENAEQWLLWHERGDPFTDCEYTAGRDPITSPYDRILEILLQTGKYEQAFWYAERRLQRVLSDLLSLNDLSTNDGALNGLIDGWKESRAIAEGAQRQLITLHQGNGGGNRELVAGVQTVVRNARTAMEERASSIVGANPALGPAMRPGGVGIAEIQKTIPPATVVLVPMVTDRSTYVFAITSTGFEVQMAAVGREQLLALRKEYLGYLQTRASLPDSEHVRPRQADKRTLELSRGLYEALVRPIERNIAGATNVIVVLPPELASIPFHALRRSALRTDPYLAERYLVSYLPSASSLMLPAKVHSRASDVVALGCAGNTPWDVEYELRDIRAFFKDVRLHFGKDATLETLQRERGDVLHLAVELQRDVDRPWNTYVVLSDGRSYDSFTPVPLGHFLTLQASGAVIFSSLGEERVTLHPAEPYVLLAAGAGEVVMNSYVPTRGAKKMFGAGMYTALQSGVAVGAAYRKAQLEMVRDPSYTAPHLWAPFFLWSR